jgi:hypothetical protein
VALASRTLVSSSNNRRNASLSAKLRFALLSIKSYAASVFLLGEARDVVDVGLSGGGVAVC